MHRLDTLLQWAAEGGVNMNGIKPVSIPGRGTGVVAERRIEAGEVVLTVPTNVMRSLNSVPCSIVQKLPALWSIHSFLAIDLTLNDVAAPWRALLPNLNDFKDCIPLLWPEQLQALLPRPAIDLVAKQRAKIQSQWKVVHEAFPTMVYHEYLESWLIINSRTFYHLTPETEKYEWEERLALLPIADLLNHAETGCQVLYDADEYTLTTAKVYATGEEVNNSYGEHPNDFLLAEYGFILTENPYDEVCIDDAILPHLSEDTTETLRNMNLMGNWKLQRGHGPCPRTRRVLRLMEHVQRGTWNNASDDDDASGYPDRTDKTLLHKILIPYASRVAERISDINNLHVGQCNQRELLLQRWTQIQIVLEQMVL